MLRFEQITFNAAVFTLLHHFKPLQLAEKRTFVQLIRAAACSIWRVEPLVVLIDGKLRDWHSRPSCLTEAPCSPSSLSILFLFGQEDYSEESSKASSEGIIEEQQGD